MTIDVLTTRHPFLNDKPKRMLIDGKWVEAASEGRSRVSIHPPAQFSRQWLRGTLRISIARSPLPGCLQRSVEQVQTGRTAEPAVETGRNRRAEFR